MYLFSGSNHVKSFQVELEKKVYYPGEKVRGVVDVVVREPVKYTSLCAEAKGEEEIGFDTALTRRLSPGGRYTTFYRANIILAGDPHSCDCNIARAVNTNTHLDDESCNLNEESIREISLSSSLTSLTVFTKGLSPGRYNFPFVFQLPRILPPSYVDDRTCGYSRLLYGVYACLFNAKRKLVKANQSFVVRMPVVNLRVWVNTYFKSEELLEICPSPYTENQDGNILGEGNLYMIKQKSTTDLININHKELNKSLRNGDNLLCEGSKNGLFLNWSTKGISVTEFVKGKVISPPLKEKKLVMLVVEKNSFENKSFKCGSFFESSSDLFFEVKRNGNIGNLLVCKNSSNVPELINSGNNVNDKNHCDNSLDSNIITGLY